MKYRSTRGKSPLVTVSQAIATGLAPHGGLYVPESWPQINCHDLVTADFPELAAKVLAPFFAEDFLSQKLSVITKESLNFPLVLKPLKDETSVLELFHGPTAAFKDFGARFLACAVQEISNASSAAAGAINKRSDAATEGSKQKIVLVATSGDTGGAVAAAFSSLTKIPVAILYPKGLVSARQEQQLTCWGPQVKAFSVKGNFDDCQKIVKEAFLNPEWQNRFQMISANSINIARLLPQMCYYAFSSLQYFSRTKVMPGYIIPSGNIGNAAAALWAKQIGFPIREIVFAHNANRSVVDYLASGDWKPHPSIATLANAMDVGNPSNMERVRDLFPDFSALKKVVSAYSVSDENIKATIRSGQTQWGEVWCPHTATAAFVRQQLQTKHWILVATAHPAKFESIVEPLIQSSVPVPGELADLLLKPAFKTEIQADLQSLQKCLF